MKWVWRLISNRHFWPIFVVIIFGILAGRSLIFQSGYFKMHDDLQMMRQLQMEKCFLDGQIPCRWVPDMGYGFGFPLFNFYPPLPYLIGEIFRILGFSFVTTVKLNFALSIIVSGITMYLLAKDFFGRIGGMLSSFFYIWAPYHAVDIYVRGGMNEAWAMAWFPLIFWLGYRLAVRDKKEVVKWLILLTLAYFALLTSHNLMVLIFTPFFGLWVILHLWRKNAWSRLSSFFISGIWALGLSAFFTLPALLENKLTHIRSQLEGYYDFTAHFVSIWQLLISRFWDYGGSAWGTVNDKMSFQIGHVHWILSLAIGGLLLLRFLLKKEKFFDRFRYDSLLLTSLYLFLVGWFSAFLTHSRSIFIYKKLSYLSYVQFPWRFLTICVFAFSFIAGAPLGIITDWKTKRGIFAKLFAVFPQLLFSFILILLILILNWNYFRPEGGKMGPLRDEEKFSSAAWELQRNGGINDYLPISAKMAPNGPQKELAQVMEGEGIIKSSDQGSYWGLFRINVKSDEAKVRINIFYFPEWKVFIREDSSSKQLKTFIPEEEIWGRMWIKLSRGDHLVYAQLYNTSIRTIANLVSLVSWGVLLILFPITNRFLSKNHLRGFLN